MVKILIGVLVGIVVAVPATAMAGGVKDVTAKVGMGTGGHSVQRFDDPEFQVKCWVSDGHRSGGISCLPWNEVKER